MAQMVSEAADYLKAGLLDRAEEIFLKLRGTERDRARLDLAQSLGTPSPAHRHASHHDRPARCGRSMRRCSWSTSLFRPWWPFS